MLSQLNSLLPPSGKISSCGSRRRIYPATSPAITYTRPLDLTILPVLYLAHQLMVATLLPELLQQVEVHQSKSTYSIYDTKRGILLRIYNDAFPRGSNGNSNAIKPDTIKREAET